MPTATSFAITCSGRWTGAITWAAAYLHVVNNVFSQSPRGVQDSWDTPGRSLCNLFDEGSIPTSNSLDSGSVMVPPAFVDPAVDFGLQFHAAVADIEPPAHEVAENDAPDGETERGAKQDVGTADDGSNVVTVDFGRKK